MLKEVTIEVTDNSNEFTERLLCIPKNIYNIVSRFIINQTDHKFNYVGTTVE